MELTLYQCQSAKNHLDKTLRYPAEMHGTLRGVCSEVSPTITVQHDNPAPYNYAFIPQFNRYYYIDDCVSVRNGVWELSLSCDVLMTYRGAIRNAMVVLENSEVVGVNEYLPSDIWTATAKTRTDIKQFPSGLSDTGEYILITSGGIAGA
jgi:hypothetical protein